MIASRLLASVLAVGLLAAGCSNDGDSNRLTSSAEPASDSSGSGGTTDGGTTDAGGEGGPIVAGSGDFEVAAAVWQTCGAGECAQVTVPLNHAEPDGETIDVALSRVPATGSPDERIGSIFVNFGGPGGEGTETILDFAVFIPNELRQRFDVISWDPRGVEDTMGLGCDDEFGDEATVLADPSDGFDDEIAADREVWDRLTACIADSPIIDDIGTVAVANDLDLLRQAVGDEKLTYLGFSYGTQLGWVYASMFPQNVRALVLDGAVPPGLLEADGVLDQLVAIEKAVDRFDIGCSQVPECPLKDEGLRNTITRLAAELEANPIPLDDGTTYGPVDLLNITVSVTYLDPVQIGQPFADAVASLRDGDVGPIVEFAALFEGGFDQGAFLSIGCADGSIRTTDADIAEIYAQAVEISPLIGAVPGGVFCDTYPGEQDGVPVLDTTGAPTLLVIGNTGDNATPYDGAVELDSLLADSVLLTYDGSGHTITFFNECVDAIVVDYFVDLVAPPAGTRCGGLPARLGVFLEDGDGGVAVLEVASGTAAEAAGVAVGDIITAVDGRPTPTLAEFPELTGGVPVTLTVNRAGAAIEIVATPSATADGWNVPVTE